MSIRVYNTLTGEKETFEPVNPGKVGIYLCGPTVYKPSHIGHAVGPVIFDAIKRYLTFRGFEVTWVVNITDVEDKLIAEAAAQNVPVFELARRVTEDYNSAMKKLGVTGIDHMPKASEYIGDIIDYIQRLVDKGAAYPSDGDVYFDVTVCKGYGKLSNRSPDEQFGQRELQSGQKRNPGDFCLWKASKPEEPDAVKFDSPWGAGRPGWHIDCSVMSMKLLGETFDIHGGGMDLIFPHHENEIAQSETATGQSFAKYWLHNGLTRFNTKKISKSDEEMARFMEKMVLTRLLAERDGELIRYLILGTHYRSPIDFSDEEVEAKRKGLMTFYRLFDRVLRITGTGVYGDSPSLSQAPGAVEEPLRGFADDVLSYRQRFVEVMDDDFNTAAAIAVLFELAGRINRFIDEQKVETEPGDASKAAVLAAGRELVELGRLLGLFLEPRAIAGAGGGERLDAVMRVLIDVRQYCRQNKDFRAADMIRDKLAEIGVTLVDRPGGTEWETR
ncbi:MAG: cysteine--tRNA ligase [Phycisphaerales bacterium]|nr:MAG: cysteine--tRNA ligase [Phycisphaerales bacterium]